MSGLDEPPQKIARVELSLASEAGFEDTTQEEWLSEGVLTDDDFQQSLEQSRLDDSQDTLNSAEPEHNESDKKDITDELGMFLIRKTDGHTNVIGEKDEIIEDDGNDTDELLQMLGEGNSKEKKPKKVLTKKKPVEQDFSDDDDIFSGAKITTLKVAKNAVIRKYPSRKSVPTPKPEEVDQPKLTKSVAVRKYSTRKQAMLVADSGESSEETPKTVKTYPVRKVPNVKQVQTRNSSPMFNKNLEKKTEKEDKKVQNINTSKSKPIGKEVVLLQRLEEKKLEKAKQERAKLEKIKLERAKQERAKQERAKQERAKQERAKLEKAKLERAKLERAKLDRAKLQKAKMEKIKQERINKEEEIEESMDEEMENHVQKKFKPSLTMMENEEMEEEEDEMFSDAESEATDDSYYDDVQSSESELDDWFALDIRAEKAGDYLPLLGYKAMELLTAEKQRVLEKVESLRQNISALTQQSKEQTKQIEESRRFLSELDTLLTHT